MVSIPTLLSSLVIEKKIFKKAQIIKILVIFIFSVVQSSFNCIWSKVNSSNIQLNDLIFLYKWRI